MKTTIKKYFFAFLLLGIFATHSAEALTPVNPENQITTLPATNITSTSAQLHGTAPSNGWVGTTIGPSYYFQYSTSLQQLSARGIKTTEQFNKDSVLITNLKPDTTYYFQFIRKVGNTMEPNQFYYAIGNIQKFTTLQEENTPFEKEPVDWEPVTLNPFFPKTFLEWLITTLVLLVIILIIRKGFMKK